MTHATCRDCDGPLSPWNVVERVDLGVCSDCGLSAVSVP